jgi:hypothetical protein
LTTDVTLTFALIAILVSAEDADLIADLRDVATNAADTKVGRRARVEAVPT